MPCHCFGHITFCNCKKVKMHAVLNRAGSRCSKLIVTSITIMKNGIDLQRKMAIGIHSLLKYQY